MNRSLVFVLVLTLCLVVASCGGKPSPTPDLIATQIAVEKAAHATMTAEAGLVTSPTLEPSPTELAPATPVTATPSPATPSPRTPLPPTRAPTGQPQRPDRSMWGFDLRADTLDLHRRYSGQLMGMSRWTAPGLLANAGDLGGSIIVSHPDPEALLELADSLTIKPEWVSLDLESWENTPADVRDNPVEAARKLVDEAHARGYRVMFFMSGNYYAQHQAEAVEIAKFVDGWMFPAQRLQVEYGPEAGWAGGVADTIRPVADSNPTIPLWILVHITHANSGSSWTAQEIIAYCEKVIDRVDGCFLYDVRDKDTGIISEILAWQPPQR